MELEGFSASLKGTTLVLVEREEDAWIPWECLPEGMTILLCGKEVRTHRLVRDSASWSLIWSPTSSREWSLLATILKAIGPVTLVLDLDALIPPFAFTEFLDTLPSVMKVQLAYVGSSLGIFGPPNTVIWSDSISIAARMEVLQTLRYKEGEAAVAAAVNAAKDSKVQLMASQVEGSWKLYWIRPADSWSLVKGLGGTARGLLRTGMVLLDIN
jgi:hypothetical protein